MTALLALSLCFQAPALAGLDAAEQKAGVEAGPALSPLVWPQHTVRSCFLFPPGSLLNLGAEDQFP